jgi:hypothetical protein
VPAADLRSTTFRGGLEGEPGSIFDNRILIRHGASEESPSRSPNRVSGSGGFGILKKVVFPERTQFWDVENKARCETRKRKK